MQTRWRGECYHSAGHCYVLFDPALIIMLLPSGMYRQNPNADRNDASEITWQSCAVGCIRLNCLKPVTLTPVQRNMKAKYHSDFTHLVITKRSTWASPLPVWWPFSSPSEWLCLPGVQTAWDWWAGRWTVHNKEIIRQDKTKCFWSDIPCMCVRHLSTWVDLTRIRQTSCK